MSNNLATLNTALGLKLRDAAGAVWATGERDTLLTWACARLYPRLARTLQETVTLVDDQDSYTLTTVSDISRVDMIDPNSTPANRLVMQMNGGTWEYWGDRETVGGTLYLNPQFASASYNLRVHGYAPYDLTSHYPPDRFVSAIIGMAAAEAIRRMMTDRAKYKQWDALSQEQNISVNEFIGLVNEGDAEYSRLLGEARTWRRPKPAIR